MAYFHIIHHPELFPKESIKFLDKDDFYFYDGAPTQEGQRPYESFEELYAHIQKRRDTKGLPYITEANLKLLVNEYLYQLKEVPRSLFGKEYIRGSAFADLKKGISIAVDLSTLPEAFVDKSKADERALKCKGCEYNVKLKKSFREKVQDHAARALSCFRKSTYHDDLDDCSVCGCALQSKVHFNKDVVIDNTEEPAYKFPRVFIHKETGEKETCWTREILEGKDG